MRVMKKQRGAAFLLQRYGKFTTGLLTAATTASVLNNLLKLPSPFFQELAAQFGTDLDNRVGPLFPFIGPTRVDDSLGSKNGRWIFAGSLLVGRDRGVGGAASATT